MNNTFAGLNCGNFSALSETMDLQVDTLDPSRHVSINLGNDYSLRSTERLYQEFPESNTEINFGRRFHLMKGDTPLITFDKEECSMEDALNPTIEYRRKLFAKVSSYLEGHEGSDKTALMKKRFLPEPADVPPWERTKPARNLNSEKYKISAHACNDDGNAIRFQEECTGYLVYDCDSKEWKAWIINHWEPAESRLFKAERFVADSIRFELEPMELDLQTAIDTRADRETLNLLKKQVREMELHVNYSKKITNMKAMAELSAASTMSVHLLKDGDADLLACKNCIIDTKTGKVYPNSEAERFKYRYPTHYIDCTYTPGAKPKLFLEHLRKVFEDNTNPDLKEHEIEWRGRDSVDSFKRYLGYLLVKGNPEQQFIFLWGSGANGKSTTMDVLRYILESEVAEAPAKELFSSRDDKPATGIARSLNSRVLLFSELSDDDSTYASARKISADLCKNLTGDKRTASFRSIYEGSTPRDILCTPIALTNNLPYFNKELDDAMLRRLITVPHNHIFSGSEKDRNMVEKLLTEKNEIFSMMVDEMIAYREDGLTPIPEHWKEGQAMLLAGDALYAFISHYYRKTDGLSQEKRMAMRIIEGNYIRWAHESMIDCHTVMRPGGTDSQGYEISVERLTTGDSRNLHKAFRAMGYTIKMYDGAPYVWCELKHS